MKTYYKNGISKEIPYIIDTSEEFVIQDLGKDYPDRYIYPGDSVKYELDIELVRLYETLQDLYFECSENYYSDIYLQPVWVQGAGQNSYFDISAETFRDFLCNESSAGIPNLYKHLYLADCQFLVGTIQNLLSGIEDAFIRYYITLASLNIDDICHETPNSTIYVMSATSRCASSILETYFTKAYSILDILCKICYEIQNKNEEFSSYRKIKSAKILWGDRKKLLINSSPRTLFESCELVRIIESLRNEYVHNGTWELNPKIFVHFNNNVIEECFMFFPDMEQGRLTTIKGRKHFFSKGIKVNDVLPSIHAESKNRLLNTIKLLNGTKL